jgi:hypothetical protein
VECTTIQTLIQQWQQDHITGILHCIHDLPPPHRSHVSEEALMFSLMVELTTRWHPEKYNAPENIEDIGPRFHPRSQDNTLLTYFSTLYRLDWTIPSPPRHLVVIWDETEGAR